VLKIYINAVNKKLDRLHKLKYNESVQNEVKKFNMQYECYLNNLIKGTDVATVINRAIDNNEKYEIGTPKITTAFLDIECDSLENEIDMDNILVIYDDMDIEPGKIRIRKSGSPGTHNGIKSVTHCLNSQNFPRVRVGIGKPKANEDVIGYVIGAIDTEDKKKLENGVEKAADAVCAILEHGIDFAMNKFN